MMHPDLRNLLYDAEIAYLQAADMTRFKTVVASLKERLEVYEYLRDREIEIFQPIADELLAAFPEENPKLLERALKHWLSIMRYCAMAMLINNPEYLQHRLLEWLTDIVQAYQMEAIETHLCKSLKASLQKGLSKPQFALVQPFIEQAQATLVSAKIPSKV
jgi:Phycobilisome protein